jgi:hypothetical protein
MNYILKKRKRLMTMMMMMKSQVVRHRAANLREVALARRVRHLN